MNRKSGSGSGIFLMEMMVVVFFFILCASTCILAFAKSDRMSKLAMERNQAVLAAESVVEIWKADGTDGWKTRLGATEDGQAAGSFQAAWDRQWESAAADAAAPYYAEIQVTDGGDSIEHAAVSVYRSSDQIQLFALEADCYRP